MSSANSLRQAALVLNSLSPEQVEQVVSRLDSNDVRTVFGAIESLDRVTTKQIFDALDQLARDAQKQVDSRYLRSKTQPATFPADSSSDLHSPEQRQSPFYFLLTAAPDLIAQLLGDEHPLDIALVLAQVPPNIAAIQLRSIDPVSRMGVLKRLCQMQTIDKQRSHELAYNLKLRLHKFMTRGGTKAVGVTVATHVLNLVDEQTREEMLTELNQADPDSAREVAAGILQFQDLARMSDGDLKALLLNVDTACWAPALKNATLEVRKKILGNLAAKPAKILIREMQSLGHIDRHIAEHAQQQILATCVRLADQRKIGQPCF